MPAGDRQGADPGQGGGDTGGPSGVLHVSEGVWRRRQPARTDSKGLQGHLQGLAAQELRG